jgi:hypothetical protein
MGMRIPIGLALLTFAGSATPLPLPDGAPGIGFDDLRYSRELGRVLVPAGRSGFLDLIDPATQKVTAIGGFSKAASYGEGHGQGVTSVDVGAGLLFATDRTTRSLNVVDPTRGAIVSHVGLSGGPDYVRFVGVTREVWVTEPGQQRIERFALTGQTLARTGEIAIPGGPESLVIDDKRGRAFTHLWKKETFAIDLQSHAVVAKWAAGCAAPRGIALDAERGYLLVGCEDGTATVLDVDHDGKLLAKAKSGRGVDIIAYDASRHHLYLPGDESATMAVIGVGAKGQLSVLATVPTVDGAHCVTTDEKGHAYVCDPSHGRLLLIQDTWPPA